MNRNMDIACKRNRTSNRVIAPISNKFITPYTGIGAMLIINSKCVMTKYASQIKDTIMAKDHIKFFLEKYKTKSEDITTASTGEALVKLVTISLIMIT